MRYDRHVPQLVIAAVIASALFVESVGCQEIHAGPEMQRRAQDLGDRLAQTSRIAVTFYGDSITAGWGTDGTHSFPHILIDHLRHRFPQCSFDERIAGNPGWTTADALRGFDRQVLATGPDLLLVQFGGNDRGWNRSLAQFRAGLTGLLERAIADTDALVIACLPPFAEEIGESAWSIAAREVAAEVGVPAAEFHRTIRESPHDFRGSFPWGSHPGSFTHVLMAKQIAHVLDACIEAPPLVRAELSRGATVSADDEQVISTTISTVAEGPVEWSITIALGDEKRELQGTVSREDPVVVSERFAIPEGLPADRAYSLPVRLEARAGSSGDFDVAWLTVAPAIEAPTEPESWHALGASELVLGKQLWRGESDLSARFRVGSTEDDLRIEVEVVDDQITVADLTDPSRGDSVELYLDLRSPEGQGRPVYTEDVLAIQVLAPQEDDGPALWRNMHDLPEDLRDIRVAAKAGDGRYAVTVELPLPAIRARRGGDWGGIGLDVGVNDADRGERKTQMMWTGIADNYLNPAYLAGVYPRQLPQGATRRIVQ